MDSLSGLLDKYVETFFVGFVTSVPFIWFLTSFDIKIKDIFSNFLESFGLEGTSNNAQALRIFSLIVCVFGMGLFFKSATYFIFENVHEKVVAHSECLINNPKVNKAQQNPVEKTDSKQDGDSQAVAIQNKNPCDMSQRELGDYFLFICNKSSEEFSDKFFNTHLPKQINWFVNQPDSYGKQIESIAKNITVAQGILISSLLGILASIWKIVVALYQRSFKYKQLGLLAMFGLLYFLSFITWWTVEVRYHTRIAVAFKENLLNEPANPISN